MQVGKAGADMKGSPEEIAERLVKDEAADELKQRELQRKGAKQVDGVAGSGLKRGEPSAVAQVCMSGKTMRSPVAQTSVQDCFLIQAARMHKQLTTFLDGLMGGLMASDVSPGC